MSTEKEAKDSSAWSRILTPQLQVYMKNVVVDTEDGVREVIGEDDKFIKEFFAYLREFGDYKATVMLSFLWKGLEDTEQANMAIAHVGWRYASLYIMLMDYLSNMLVNNGGKLQ